MKKFSKMFLLSVLLVSMLATTCSAAVVKHELCVDVGEVPLMVYNVAEGHEYRSLKDEMFIIYSAKSDCYYVTYANNPACYWNSDAFYMGGNSQNFLENCYHIKISTAGTILEDKGEQKYMEGWYVNAANATPVFSTCEVKWSHTNGKTFFMKSPSPVQVMGMAVREMSETVVGQMVLLATCGVGCLALLMALPLLARKLRIFLH